MSAAGARNPGEGAELLAAQADALQFEQPSAPYLDALVAVSFRGSTRFHVPGHKGGPGADPGLRHAIGDGALALDLPQDVEGIDVGPGPTPYQRAEELAAQAYGAGRTWFLTNGATQGNHALCLALGAAAVLTSTHKIVGSLTQSAMLHLAGDGRIDPDLVASGVRLVRSTRPSSLLLGS